MWQLLILLIDMFIAGNSEAVGQIERSTLRLSKNFQRLEEQNLPSTLRCDGMTFERKWYADFDALEWQVRLRAPINGDVPVFDNLPSADFAVTFPKVTTTTLHSSQGSHGDTTDFRMRSEELTAGNIVSLSSFGGRSSDGTMPYFNLESGAGGLIVAIGWSGDWKATLLRQDDGSIHVTAGLKQAHFRLLNQESVRLPSIFDHAVSGIVDPGPEQIPTSDAAISYAVKPQAHGRDAGCCQCSRHDWIQRHVGNKSHCIGHRHRCIKVTDRYILA